MQQTLAEIQSTSIGNEEVFTSMKYTRNVIVKYTIGIVIAILLITTLALNTGCSAGGANIRLHGMSLGTVTMDGKPVEGLPSEKIDLLLEVSVKEITVDYSANGAIYFQPSTAGEGTGERRDYPCSG